MEKFLLGEVDVGRKGSQLSNEPGVRAPLLLEAGLEECWRLNAEESGNLNMPLQSEKDIKTFAFHFIKI